jgi:hypothetical protein
VEPGSRPELCRPREDRSPCLVRHWHSFSVRRRGTGRGRCAKRWHNCAIHGRFVGERADHIDKWRQLTVGENNPQPVGKLGRPSRGHQATASALGISHETVRRAEAIAGLPQAVRDQAREERWSQEQLLNMARDKDMRFPPSCPGLPRFLEKRRSMPCRRRGIDCHVGGIRCTQ